MVKISLQLKFIYSEKAKNFCEISTLLLSVCTVDILLWHPQNIRTLSACPSIGNFVEFNKEFYFSFLILIDYSSNKSRFGRAGINLYYGLRTPNEAFFHRNSKLLGLNRQFGQIRFGSFRVFFGWFFQGVPWIYWSFFTGISYKEVVSYHSWPDG